MAAAPCVHPIGRNPAWPSGLVRAFHVLLIALGLVALVPTVADAAFVSSAGFPVAVGAQPYGVLAQDLDGDGRVDLATVNGTSSDLSIFLGIGGGGFGPASGSPFATGAGPSGATVAEFNGDGRPDIAVSNYVSGTVSVLLGQPGGGWVQEVGGTVSAPGAGAVAAADVNGDGRPDLLVPDYNSGDVTVLLRKAGGGFEPGGSTATGTNPRALAVADFNGDGRPDMAVTNSGSGTVSVLLGQAGGGFAAEGVPVPVGSRPSGIVAPDLNGDGLPDLAVANYGSGNVSLLLRQALGGFAAEPASPVAVGAGPVGLVAPDLDGDGRPDLAVTDNTAGTVSVLLRGAGGYVADASSPIVMPAGPSGIAAADVDGDGHPDLAVSSDQADVLNLLMNRIAPGAAPAPSAGLRGIPAPGPVAAPAPAPVVVGLAATRIGLPGGGGKVPPRLGTALKGVELGAPLASATASSSVQVKSSGAPTQPDPRLEQTLGSYAYGIPVSVNGSPGEVVGIAGAVAIASKAGSGTRIGIVQLPPAYFQLYAQTSIVRLPVDAKAAAELERSGAGQAAAAVTAQEIAIDRATEMSEESKRDADEAMEREKAAMDNIRKLLEKLQALQGAVLLRPIGPPESRKSLERQIATAARKVNGLAHRAAVLIAPVVRAHPTRSPGAAFALKPCSRRCPYPRFGH
jgi:FG-GAP-like repeat/FG-GAP repeat